MMSAWKKNNWKSNSWESGELVRICRHYMDSFQALLNVEPMFLPMQLEQRLWHIHQNKVWNWRSSRIILRLRT